MSSSPTSNKNLPATLLAGSFAAGIAGAFVYNKYLIRVQQEQQQTSSRTRRTNATFSSSNAEDNAFANIFNTGEISTSVLNHLARVYATLGATTFAAVLGVLIQRQTKFPASISSLISLGFSLSLASSKAEMWKLLGFGLFNGMGLGDLVSIALRVNPNLVPVALASTSAVFGSFAAAAALSPRRSLLYLYGILGSALSVLSVTSLANVFFENRMVFNLNLYGGLAMFVGYVCADSQMIIERADQGDHDHVTHAWMLFTDLSAIFTRLLVILLKQQEEQEKKKRRGRRDED